MEIELKLSLPETALPALFEHPLIASAALLQKKQKLINVYYDTPALDLHQARVAVRTRKAGRQWLQTIKCARASVGGLSSRPEWEQPYKQKRFDFSVVTDETARSLLEKHAADIIPVFTTTFNRETRLLQPDADTRILLMIDHGHIETQGKQSPICEIELELEQGNPLQLFDLALCLAADLPLLPEDVSKAERGYRLFLGTPIQPTTLQSVALHAQQTPLEAFRDLSFAALQVWQSNTSNILANHAQQTVSGLMTDYYKSIERLRLLLKIFGSILDKNFVKHWQRTLRSASRQTGELRRLLCLQQYLLTHTEHFTLSIPLSILQGHLATLQFAAIDTLRQHLQHNGLLILAYSQALHSIDRTSSEQDIDSFAQEILQRLYQSAQKKYDQNLSTPRSKLSHYPLLMALRRVEESLNIFSFLYPDEVIHEEQHSLQQSMVILQGIEELTESCLALSVLKKTLRDAEYQSIRKEIKARLKSQKKRLHPLFGPSSNSSVKKTTDKHH